MFAEIVGLELREKFGLHTCNLAASSLPLTT